MYNKIKTTKTLLFASLITAMILPFSMMDVAVAEEVNKNPKDKIFERQQEKLDREIISQNLKAKHLEKEELEKQIRKDEYKKQQKEARINQIDSEVDQIKNDNHKKDISQTKLQKLINNQRQNKIFAKFKISNCNFKND